MFLWIDFKKGSMNKVYCINWNKHRKSKSPKNFNKTLTLYIIYDTCGSKDENIFKKEETIEVLKFLI